MVCVCVAIDHVHIYRGGWDTEGVSVVSIDNKTSTITCNSTHLTSFAVLADVSGGHNVCNHVVVLYSCGINAIVTISVHIIIICVHLYAIF